MEEAIKLDPKAYKSTRVDAYLAVADQYNQAGDLDKYIEFLAKAVAESPQTASLHLKLGYAYEEVAEVRARPSPSGGWCWTSSPTIRSG